MRDEVIEWIGVGSINVFGLPMGGKDTQCRRLGQVLDGPVLGGGDILRKREDLPPAVKDMMNRGELIPIDDYLRIVTPYLAQAEFNGHPLILSSVGRFKGEEQSVRRACEAAGHPLRAVVLLELDHDEVWKRWHAAQSLMDRGMRVDDEAAALEVRLEEFRHKTQPVLDYYDQAQLLVRVDGSGTPEEVEQQIWQALHGRVPVA
jgi:adenylate kinase